MLFTVSVTRLIRPECCRDNVEETVSGGRPTGPPAGERDASAGELLKLRAKRAKRKTELFFIHHCLCMFFFFFFLKLTGQEKLKITVVKGQQKEAR